MTTDDRHRAADGNQRSTRRNGPDLAANGARSGLSRRRFLQSLTAIGAATAGGGALFAYGGGSRSRRQEPLAIARPNDIAAGGLGEPGGELTAGRLVHGAVDDRILVVVDLQGGNDALSTLIPAGDPRYYDLRPNLAVAQDEVLPLDDEVGLHPSLERLNRRGITTVEGVGPVDGDLSHFAMTERWERGDVTGDRGLRTGFLGRLTDSVDDGSSLVGASMIGPTAHLTTNQAATMALGGPDELWYLEPSDWSEVVAFQNGLAAFDSAAFDSAAFDASRAADLSGEIVESYGELTSLARDLASSQDRDADWDDPMIQEGGRLGENLYFAADLIAADVGLRVVYAADGDYDTHTDHPWRQADNLRRVDAAVDGFLNRAEDLGFADRVLVATISEFGRRVPENNGGLDHGSASTMLLAGPVGDKRLGERPPLDDLDDEDNLRVTVPFDRYLAGLAEEWLGIEAASVLPGEPEPLRFL